MIVEQMDGGIGDGGWRAGVASGSIDPLPHLPAWKADESLATAYASAAPFPHIVIDDVLDEEVYRKALAEFPPVGSPGWMNYVHVNETKFGNTKPATWGSTLQSIAKAFTAPRFVQFLEQLTGIDDLLADRTMDGGGLHQTLTGGHLNVHADFTAHHTVPGWRRRINVLLYLNETWDPEWGGGLELWSTDMSDAVSTITPVGNRMLVFTTDEESYHGHPDPLTCPAGIARQSLALYYFTTDERFSVRSTNYRARPGDGIKRVGIWADKTALRAYDVAKRRFKIKDQTISRLLGSSRRARPGAE